MSAKLGRLMLATVSACVLVLTVVGTTAGRIIYVDDDGDGDGSSWFNAYKYLQDALADANSPEKPVEIRVAEGIYKPDKGAGITPGDRTATFQLQNGVAIMGGYAGYRQPDPDARDVNVYETILSGDLAGDDVDANDVWELEEHARSRFENSLHVVTGGGVGETAVLSGVVITGGDASSGYDYVEEPDRHGGGVYIHGGSPTIAECIFRQNRSWSGGGGMYARLSGAVIVRCKFICNFAAGLGRGYLGYGGGGLFNDASRTVLRDCTFSGNATYRRGGGIFNYDGSNAEITGCTFSGNSGETGGGILNHNGSDAAITGCLFIGNSASTDGGGMSNREGSSPVVTNCEFIANSARAGGGVDNVESHPLLTWCTFMGNVAGEGGGVCSDMGSNPVLRRCVVAENVANDGMTGTGGGISIGCGSEPLVVDCIIKGNRSVWRGGGISCGQCPGGEFGPDVTIRNCIVSGNRTGGYGGGIHCDGYSAVVRNCTLVGNAAEDRGGGISTDFLPDMSNCVIWNNRDCGGQSESAQVYKHDTYEAGPEINYNCVEGLTGALGGAGNTGADPCFAEAGYWDPNGTDTDPNDDFWVDGDYHLKSEAGRWDPATQAWIADDTTSPCIDAGSPRHPIGHEPFPNGGVVNMGAYGGSAEASKSYFGEPVCETIVVGDINGDCRIDLLDFVLMTNHWLEDIVGQASDPRPADGATGVSNKYCRLSLGWTAGINAIWHDVYVGTDRTVVAEAHEGSPEYMGRQFRPRYGRCDLFQRGITYYWRIDEIGCIGSRTGPVWSFTTATE